ncbi:MAG TPA: hypothetical protein VFT10_08810 [Solirubrobacterales bacterium]|nr:hypothetical protein [Solirubrobacterales bacterium]
MGILDEAIKEHLELKRQHGAGESELKQLEDEAFGAAERPGDEEPVSDALAEAPTAFMAQPEVAETDADDTSSRRRPAPQIADLQEAPEQNAPVEEELPAEEEAPAMEHEAVVEPEAPASHSTEERQAIAEHPTEMYDVEEELADQERAAPSEEELIEEEMSEPRLAPVDTLAGIEEADVAPEVEVAKAREDEDEDLDDEFWDEKRLSDELDEALEAPGETDVEVEAVEPVAEEAAPEAEDEGQEQSRPRDEDVLEETPDFLEEAPEDDQLWFEQKPPKDFDFDD